MSGQWRHQDGCGQLQPGTMFSGALRGGGTLPVVVSFDSRANMDRYPVSFHYRSSSVLLRSV